MKKLIFFFWNAIKGLVILTGCLLSAVYVVSTFPIFFLLCFFEWYTPSLPSEAAPGWLVILFIPGFLAWCGYFLGYLAEFGESI